MLSALLTLTIASFPSLSTLDSRLSTDLRGLWLKQTSDRQEFRFYYFHGNGIGLYRYGRRSLNNTNSYDYRVDGRDLVLRFRKTGEEHRVRYRIDRDGEQAILILENDPREPAPARYRKIEGPLEMSDVVAGDHPFARMWTEQKKFATGGSGFRIYQFQPPQSDGSGHGWYHQGDFDDWSTEAFSYVKKAGQLHLYFIEKKEHEVTDFVEQTGQKRAIELISDPRNFWHRARFEDGGRSIINLGGTAFLGDPRVR